MADNFRCRYDLEVFGCFAGLQAEFILLRFLVRYSAVQFLFSFTRADMSLVKNIYIMLHVLYINIDILISVTI